MANMIVIWSGAVVDIPFGWKLCDGNNGTPDLRNKFVIGAGDTFNPGDDAASTVAASTFMHWYALCFIMKVP